jgi:hypothetical protein
MYKSCATVWWCWLCWFRWRKSGLQHTQLSKYVDNLVIENKKVVFLDNLKINHGSFIAVMSYCYFRYDTLTILWDIWCIWIRYKDAGLYGKTYVFLTEFNIRPFAVKIRRSQNSNMKYSCAVVISNYLSFNSLVAYYLFCFFLIV